MSKVSALRLSTGTETLAMAPLASGRFLCAKFHFLTFSSSPRSQSVQSQEWSQCHRLPPSDDHQPRRCCINPSEPACLAGQWAEPEFFLGSSLTATFTPNLLFFIFILPLSASTPAPLSFVFSFWTRCLSSRKVSCPFLFAVQNYYTEKI